MVLRCISTSCLTSSSSMHPKGASGLKSLFWRKFRKRKGANTTTVKKKRLSLTGEGNDRKGRVQVESGGGALGNTSDAEITTLTQQMLQQPSTPPSSAALIAVSWKICCCDVSSQVICKCHYFPIA